MRIAGAAGGSYRRDNEPKQPHCPLRPLDSTVRVTCLALFGRPLARFELGTGGEPNLHRLEPRSGMAEAR